jgi:hypothetical protein
MTFLLLIVFAVAVLAPCLGLTLIERRRRRAERPAA